MNNIVKVFYEYELVGGHFSLVRFMHFVEEIKNQRIKKRIFNLYKDFKNDINKNDFYIRKDFINFRKYVFNIIKER